MLVILVKCRDYLRNGTLEYKAVEARMRFVAYTDELELLLQQELEAVDRSGTHWWLQDVPIKQCRLPDDLWHQQHNVGVGVGQPRLVNNRDC